MKRLVLLGVVLALVCAAAVPAAPPSTKAIAAVRERAAGREAVALLDRIRLPAGAQAARTVPASLRRVNLGVSVLTMFAYRHRFWKLREPVARVLDFVKTHAPAGYTNSGGCSLTCLNFDQAPVHGRPMQRMYAVAVARQGGWTFVRLDAGAAWVYPRSPREVLPPGVREIEVRAGQVDRTVTAPAAVARIAGWFRTLTVVPPGMGTVGCMLVLGTSVNFTFRGAQHAVLATAAVPSGGADGCNPISFSVGGRSQPALIDTRFGKYSFAARVEALLGVCFNAGPGGGTVSPRCNKAWAAQKATESLDGFRLPHGAQRLAKEPGGDGGVLRSPLDVPGTEELVDKHRFWKIHLPLAAVAAFVKREHHAPQAGSGTTGGPGVPPNRTLSFTYDSRNGVVASRTLEVTFVTLRDGWTGIRADAQVIWIYPRTQRQMAPANTQVIDMQAGSTTRRITGSRTVERIVSRFDRLEVVQPGTPYHCPGNFGRREKITIVFHAVNPTASARAVSYGTGPSGPCSPLGFSVHGRTTGLLGGNFVQWLEGVLGVKFQ